MPTCPVCDSRQILIVLSDTRRGSCRDCGARWTQDGSVLFRLPGAMTVQPGELGETIRTDHILNVTNLNLEHPGRYAFDVLVDGQVAATVPLRVEQIPARH